MPARSAKKHGKPRRAGSPPQATARPAGDPGRGHHPGLWAETALAAIMERTEGFQKRTFMVSTALGALFPLAFLADDLIHGVPPRYMSYGLSFAALLLLCFWGWRKRFSSLMAYAAVLALILGFVLSLVFPGGHHSYVVILVAFTPIAYILLGATRGRLAVFLFCAVAVATVAARRLGLLSFADAPYRPEELAMTMVAVLFQNVLAAVSEARHRRGIALLMDKYYLDDSTRLPNASALELEALAEGQTVIIASIANFRDLVAVVDGGQESLPLLLSKALTDWARDCGFVDRGPYRLSESEFAFVGHGQAEQEGASESLLDFFSELPASAGTPLRFSARVVSYRCHARGPAADALEAAYAVLTDCVAVERLSLHRAGGNEFGMRSELRLSAPTVIRNIQDALFKPVFQPVYDDLRDGVGFCEALIRLEVDGSLVSPEPFLETAMRLGLDRYLTDFILDAAVDMAVASGNSVSFNVTFRDLEYPFFRKALRAAYARLQGSPATLIVELTEHAAFKDSFHVSGFVREVHESGGLVFLDDFGSGYSNYSSLLDAQFDAVKTAGHIVSEIARRPDAAILYNGMTAFCRVAGLEVVAEHISDREILAKAKEGGARYFQGYLFSKPLSAEVILGKGFAFPEGCQSGPVPLRPAAAVAGSERT